MSTWWATSGVVGSAVMVGLVGYSQSVAYPALGWLNPAARARFHEAHSHGIAVWAALGLITCGAAGLGALLAVLDTGAPGSRTAALACLLAAAAVGVSTLFAAARHTQLGHAQSEETVMAALRSLLRINAIRLVACGALLVSALWALSAS